MTISSSSTQEEDLLPGLTPPSHSPSFRFTPAIHNPKINGNSGIHEDHVNENENEDKNSVTMEIDTNQADDPSDEETPMEVDSDHEGNIPQSTTPVPSTPIQTTPFPLTSLNFTPTPFNQKRLSIGTLTKPQPLDTAHYLSAASQALLEERKGPLQRLVITYMVLENFKSYAGTQKIGPFHKSFTAVVGANGSGKSNIIDALLFVFGYRANKLRQSKLGHLIHHSDKFPDLSQCTVSVLFQEILEYPDGVTTIVPNSEFSISRTAFRNHSSKYAINKETQPFSEVVDLLKSKQVDLDNHRFLILQGEVESIAQMKAKAPNEHEDGLLEYLEDIIGTGHYKVPIAAKLLELDEVNEQRNEKLARAVFVEQEKKRLEASKLQAEQFLQKEQVCHHHEAWLVHVRTDQLKERAEESQEKLTKVVEAMKELESKFETMSSDHLQLEEEMKQAQKDLQISQQQIQEIEKKSSTMATEDVKVREIQKSLKRKIEKVEKSIDKHMFTIAEQERWLTNDAKDAEKFQLELTSLHKQHEVNVQTLEKMDLELRFKTHDVQVQLDQLKTKRLPLHSEWQQKKGDLELVQSEMEAFFEQQRRHEHSLNQSKEKLHTQSQQLTTFQTQLDTLLHEKKTHQAELSKLHGQRQNHEATQMRLKKELHEVRVKLEALKDNFHSQRSKNQAVDGLLRLKTQLPGIYDRLGHLGTLPPQYDVAASTAFSGLDYMVVDTVSTGQRCLEYLRTQGLGRVSLICLDKLANYSMKPIATPENAVRLFDEVHVHDEKFKAAFYHVMRDTLVADTLEQANRIAFTPNRRWRVVTLDGQVIDTSGTMAGGGSQKMRGKILLGTHPKASTSNASSSFSSTSGATKEEEGSLLEKSQLEQRQESLTKQLRDWQLQQEHLEAHFQEVTQAFTKADQQWALTHLQFQQLESKQKEDEAQWQMLKRDYPTLQHQQAEKKVHLETRLQAFTSKVEELHLKVKEMDGWIDQKQEEIDDIGGMTYKVLKYQVQTETAEIEKLTHQVAKSQVQQKQAEKQKVQSEEKIQGLQLELKELKHEQELVQTQWETQKELSKKLTQDRKTIQRDVDQCEQRVQTLQKALEEHADDVLAYKKQKANFTRTKDQLEQQWKDVRHQLSMTQQRWEGFSLSIQEGAQHLMKETSGVPLVTELQAKVNQLKQEVQHMAENVQLGVLDEYKQRDQEHQHRLQELDQVTVHRDQVKHDCDTLKKQRLKEFMMGFALISQKLKEMYLLMTCGGNAELELVDSMDPFSEGILFSVMPPKKSWKQIHHLSGGEKTLASLALVFALHHYKPTPVYVMDEIDAALDFRNVSIIAQYIKEQTHTAQFIIISLRHNMFELSDRLVGIYKTDQCTKSISVDPHAFQIMDMSQPHLSSTSKA